jgi:hypothetical protein
VWDSDREVVLEGMEGGTCVARNIW